MWGTRKPHGARRPQGRFIPTHVGNTARRSSSRKPAPVHPHACGEHLHSSVECRPADGSSPRMWGTPYDNNGQTPGGRFIPTHVGNTAGGEKSRRKEPVHPHACGEHKALPSCRAVLRGSSPRMWGTRALSTLSVIWPRFIPTHVGNTPCGSWVRA